MQYRMMHRFVLSMVGGVILLAGSPGCQVAKSSFQMDSDSRLPFFGLQMAPKKKEPKPNVSPLSQSEAPVAKTTPASFDGEAATPRGSRWSKWFGRFGKPKRIPLPITDSPADDDSPVIVGADVDGLGEF